MHRGLQIGLWGTRKKGIAHGGRGRPGSVLGVSGVEYRVSGPPLTAEATGLIEKEISAMWFYIRGVVGRENH